MDLNKWLNRYPFKEVILILFAYLEAVLYLSIDLRFFYMINAVLLLYLSVKAKKLGYFGKYLLSMIFAAIFSLLLGNKALFPLAIISSVFVSIFSRDYRFGEIYFDLPLLFFVIYFAFFPYIFNLNILFALSLFLAIAAYLNPDPYNLLYSFFVSYLILQFSMREIILALGVTFILSYTAFLLKSLTNDGLYASLLVGVLSYLISPIFFLLLVVFYLSAVFFSKFLPKPKALFAKNYKQEGPRNSVQVYSNSFAMLLFGYLYSISLTSAGAAIAAIAASTADTWATEIGMRFGKKPIIITNFKPAEKGRSGAISLEGTIATIFAGLFIGFLSAFSFGLISFKYSLVGAIFGSLIDSFLGATAQALYKCKVCRRFTESKIHHNVEAILYKGLDWFDNDVVNFLSSFLVGLVYL